MIKIKLIWAMKYILTITCSLVVIVSSSYAATDVNTEVTIDTAITAVEKEEYEKAFKQFQFLANKDDAEAQHNLAMLYRFGKGVKKDLKLSSKWFRKAADQGIVDAQYYLGHNYDVGEGVDENKEYAYVWYKKAAENGHGLAQINLGVLYANGLGIDRDIERAYLWFHVATAQGYKVAFENKEIIKKELKPEVVEKLKQEGRIYYQKYVLPFQNNSASRSRLRRPNVNAH